MIELERIARLIRKRLDKKNEAREVAINKSRQIIRECRSSISAMQASRDYIGYLKSARAHARDLLKSTSKYSDLLHAGYALDAQQELAEAEILASFIEEKAFPSPESIRVTDEAFVLGIGDAIGELRRLFLNRLMDDDMKDAKKNLERMEELFKILMTFDYPDSLLASKRKQDVARAVLEKSRSELVMSSHMHELRRRLKK